jgi:tripeptide aminopeptidase
MINKNRLVKTFLELARIPGLSGKEGLVAAELARRLSRLGIKYHFDIPTRPGNKVGNLIAYIKGNAPGPALLINAHIDTVGPIEPFGCRRRGNFLESKGQSILGADDRSGVAAILEALAHLKESGIRHGPLEIVFTVAEEIGLLGAKALDYKLLSARHGIVLDSDSPLEPVIAAPEAYRLNFQIRGKAAHAGVAPEKGINAIQIASRAISRLRLGRIDFETTANIGLISGGSATNIVPEFAEARGEARSHNRRKLQTQIRQMRMAFRQAVREARLGTRAFAGLPRLSEEIILDYPRMRLDSQSLVLRLMKEAARTLGCKISPKVGGGGSDANIFNAHRIESLVIGTGMEKVHTTSERLNLNQFHLGVQMLVRAIELFPSFCRSK